MEHVDWQINKSHAECSKYILENEVDCDVSFKVGEDQEVIKAHKFIMRMRSPVFDSMFNGCFQESTTDPVIPDVSPAAFHTLLRYCYYECLDIEGDVALSVLYAATKYMLPILEKAARKTLIKKLDSSKIWDVCKYATDFDDSELYADCMKYLKYNLNERNIVDVMRYAVTTGHEELNTYCRRHFKENLNERNILDVIKYVVSIGDDNLHATCKGHLKKHLSGSNVWDIYQYALNNADTEIHQHCREYFVRDVTIVREALQSVKFTNIQYKALLDVVRINNEVDETVGIEYTAGISISEIELFTACNAWAEAECLRQKIEPSGANKRTVLGECLSLIRLPTMLQQDLITLVYPTGILTQAVIVNMGQYMHRDATRSECQVDFSSRRRQFVVVPSESSSGYRPVHIESAVRVMLSRVWPVVSGSYKVSVRDERSQRSWSMVLGTKHGNQLIGDTDHIRPYIDIEPPQVLEAGSRYTVTAECIQIGTVMWREPGVQYITIPEKYSPYNEVKITHDSNADCDICRLTLSLV